MQVFLAGYNVDTTTIQDLIDGKQVDKNQCTPETISAAYARISRDPRPVNELRASARQEVEKARRSNEKIIFDMGHSSVAEHAVFNFDVIGISRLAVEALEHFRLCSFTEKSQRYITLDCDNVLPSEIAGTPHEHAYLECIKKQNDFYHKAFALLTDHVMKTNPDKAADPKNKGLLEGWAKEDARYATALATHTQLGMTVNARTLELMLRRFAAHPFAEVRELGEKIFATVNNIAPSIVRYTAATDYDTTTYPALAALAHETIPHETTINPDVQLVHFDADADDRIVAALLHTVSSAPFTAVYKRVHGMSPDEKKRVIATACDTMKFFDAVLREFEYSDFTFELCISASCFAQIKRHRMATITCQQYMPVHIIPQSIVSIGLEKEFEALMQHTEKVYRAIAKDVPSHAQYILTNAHKRRVLMKLNARELYHFSRLREDEHAQRDIRDIAYAMSAEAKKVAPLTCMLLGGKDEFRK